MSTGYTESSYSKPKRRVRQISPDRGGPERIGNPNDDTRFESIPPPPPVPPPPPPRSRNRPRPRQRMPQRNEYYDDPYYQPPPPRSRGSPRPRPRRVGAVPPPAPAYYPDDDYYDYPESRSRPPPRRQPPTRDEPKRSQPSSSSGSRGGGALAAIVILVIVILLLYMFRGPIADFLNDPPSLRNYEYSSQVDFVVEKRMQLQCIGDPPDDSMSYTIKSACPKDYTIDNSKIQDVKDVDVSPLPFSGFPDYNDPQLETMIWEDDDFIGTLSITVKYTITTVSKQWKDYITEEESGDISDIPDSLKQRFNHDEWRIDDNNDNILDRSEDVDNDGEWDYRIEPTNPEIKNLAKRLADGETNVYKVVKNIFLYLTKEENLNYVPSQQGLPKECTRTLNIKQGDCDDYSILFISMLRSLNIPAYLELGQLYDKENKAWGGHAWAKVIIPFKSGGYAIPTFDIVNTNKFRDYEDVLYHDAYRFIEWTDTGDPQGELIYPGETEPRSNLDYYYHTFSYQYTGDPQIVSPDTNNFITIDIRESSNKDVIPAKDDGSGLGGLCMLPGFEAINLIAVISVVTVFIIISPKRRKK